MSITISSSNSKLYTYPVGFPLGESTDVCSAAETIINNYTTIRNNLCSQLYGIFNANPASLDDNTFPLKIADFIKDVCNDSDAANLAYKFYGCKIINQINQLSDYIRQATALKDALNACINADTAHEKVVQLQMLFQWSKEITDEFSTHYVYDFAEDTWMTAQDDYQNGQPTQFSGFANSFANLHNKTVASAPASTPTKTIEVFNELNLLDRLKYIKLYYDVNAGKSEYVFPEGNESIGYPCEKTDKEEYIAALEKFFMGYLIDRDGPVNAMSAFLDIKVTALRENIQLLAKQIESYNVYLKFINKGLELLNESQHSDTGRTGRIPEGVAVAVAYLLGNNMYNIVEAEDIQGNRIKCMVVPNLSHTHTEYFLVKADTEGMNFLLGSNGSANCDDDDDNWGSRGSRGNGACLLWNDNVQLCYFREGFGDHTVTKIRREKDKFGIEIEVEYTAVEGPHFHELYNYNTDRPEEDRINFTQAVFYANETKNFASNNSCFYGEYYDTKVIKLKEPISNLPPKKLDVQTIQPLSLKGWKNGYWRHTIYGKTMIESWTDAFATKTKYIDTAIETCNTDIELLRKKIDTLDTLSSTLRRRIQDVYSKILSKMPK